ncbi:MAG: TetR family transcriptional regulator [Alphaproteobacteria bacterium]
MAKKTSSSRTKAKRAPAPKPSRSRRKRGRPSTGDAVDRRQKLLDSARTLLGERGSARLTLGEIARHAGVDAAMVKYYFGSKDALFYTVVNDIIGGWLATAQRMLGHGKTPVLKLRGRMGGLAQMRRSAFFIDRHMLEEIIDARGSPMEKNFGRLVEHAIAQYRAIFDAGVAGGELRRVDPAFFFVAVLGLMDFLFSFRPMLRYVAGKGEPIEKIEQRYTQELVEMVLYGVVRRKGRA